MDKDQAAENEPPGENDWVELPQVPVVPADNLPPATIRPADDPERPPAPVKPRENRPAQPAAVEAAVLIRPALTDDAGVAVEVEVGEIPPAQFQDPPPLPPVAVDMIDVAPPVVGVNFGWQAFGNMQAEASLVGQQEIWLRAVENTLTDEQKANWQKVAARRFAIRQQALVDMCVSRMDEHLLLADDQREKLTELLKKQYAKQIQQMFPPGNALMQIPASSLMAMIPADQVNGFLSKAQMNRWDDLKSQQAQALFFNAPPAAFGGIR